MQPHLGRIDQLACPVSGMPGTDRWKHVIQPVLGVPGQGGSAGRRTPQKQRLAAGGIRVRGVGAGSRVEVG